MIFYCIIEENIILTIIFFSSTDAEIQIPSPRVSLLCVIRDNPQLMNFL